MTTPLRLLLVIALFGATTLSAQSAQPTPKDLRGSKPSVERMYDFALAHNLPFYDTPDEVQAAGASGNLVPIAPDSTYDIWAGLANPLVTREARAFVTAFAPQYRTACGTRPTVTSGTRSRREQPRNAVSHSVHPTGIAVDFRRPEPGPCLTWVRNALVELEQQGIIEATEEHHPVHLHIAVLVAPGTRVRLPRLAPTTPVAPPPMDTLATGVILPRLAPGHVPPHVRWGDVRIGANETLATVSARVGVPVSKLAEVNSLHLWSVLRPGTTLRVPVTP